MTELTAQEYDYPSIGTSIGRGWSSYMGQPTQAMCVTGTPSPLQVNSNSVTYTDVFDREQLLSSMRVSAKASYGAIVSGRASFSRSVRIDRSVRNIVATVDVIYNGESWAPQANSDGFKQIALEPHALAVLTDPSKKPEDRLDAFYRMCGDSYVAAIHNGARLNSVFFLALNEQETKENFSANLSGGYGGFSGSADARSTVQRNKTSNQLKFEQTHWGGPAGVANSPQEMLTRIDQFAKLTPDQAKPFSVWTRSYRFVTNWPTEFLYSGLSPRTVSLMAGQVWRLQELGELYADAATAPHRYYFPFTPGGSVKDFQKASVDRSDALLAASTCLHNLAAVCASRTRCEMKEVFKPETITQVCPALKDASESFRSTVTAAMLGSRPNRNLQDVSKAIQQNVETASKMFTTNVSTHAAADPASTAGTTGPAPTELGLTPAEVYYQLLAQAPIPRSWDGPTHNTRNARDATVQLDWYCAFEKLNCADITYEKLAVEGKAPESAQALVKAWIVRTKLLPLAQGFCREIGHPMCLSQAQLSALTNSLNPQFGPSRNFTLAPPPPPPPPPPARPRPSVREWPCLRPGSFSCL